MTVMTAEQYVSDIKKKIHHIAKICKLSADDEYSIFNNISCDAVNKIYMTLIVKGKLD